jgi:hypothetical protein
VSKIIATIKNTGQNKVDMDINRFYGGEKNGIMLQVTQGSAGFGVIRTINGFKAAPDETGFIHLTKKDAQQLAKELTKWISIM